MKTAQEHAEALMRELVHRTTVINLDDSVLTRFRLHFADAIAAARADERERCAKVLDAEVEQWTREILSHDSGRGPENGERRKYLDYARQISAKFRALPAPGSEGGR